MGKREIEVDDRQAMTRRRFIKAGLGVAGGIAGGLMLPPGMVDPAFAAEPLPPALGNYPAGVEGDSVFMGLTCDLTGPYTAAGHEEQRGYELAISQLNAGAPLAKKVSPLTRRGVLGKTVRYGVGDSHTNPKQGLEVATRFIEQNNAMVVQGSTSSSVAIALEKLCTEHHLPYFAAISGSNATTGKDCQRYGFRLCFSAYPAAKAISPELVKALGKNKKTAFSIPDYTAGITTFESVSQFTASDGGWKVVSKQLHPLGTTDYGSYLYNISKSDADVLVVVDYGTDAANCIRQAKAFGLLDRMTLVIPYMSSYLPDRLGPEIMQGVFACSGFWWTLRDDTKFPLAKDFVEAWHGRYNRYPRDAGYYAWLSTLLWADAVERAGSFYPVKVVKALEDSVKVKRETPIGPAWFRAQDHIGVANFPVLRGKKPAAMKNKDDYFDIVAIADGAEVAPPVGHFGCKLGPYV